MGRHTDSWELGTIYSNHAQVADFPFPSQVEEGQSDNADLLVRGRSTTTDEASGVLSRSHLLSSCVSFNRTSSSRNTPMRQLLSHTINTLGGAILKLSTVQLYDFRYIQDLFRGRVEGKEEEGVQFAYSPGQKPDTSTRSLLCPKYSVSILLTYMLHIERREQKISFRLSINA